MILKRWQFRLFNLLFIGHYNDLQIEKITDTEFYILAVS